MRGLLSFMIEAQTLLMGWMEPSPATSVYRLDNGIEPRWVDYKAPHANRGTPTRARKGKLRSKLFKGHRP
jgi:hypothetical protein